METTYTDAQLRRLLLETLEKTPRLRRKALLERCVAQLDFSQTQLSDRTAGSPVIRCKSRLGALLSELIRSGDIAESESGYLGIRRPAGAGCGFFAWRAAPRGGAAPAGALRPG